MKKIKISLSYIMISLVITILLISPDYIFKYFNKYYMAEFSLKNFIPIYLIIILVQSIRFKALKYIIYSFFIFLSFTELSYFNYFGGLMSPHSVILAFTESKEIFETLINVLNIFIDPLIATLPSLLIILFIVKKIDTPTSLSDKPILVFILLLMILPLKAYFSKSSKRFEANIKSYSVKNSLYAVSYFIGKDLPDFLFGDKTLKNQSRYKPYKIIRKNLPNDKYINVVLVIGESLTYERISLFGYNKDTTPKLSSLTKDKNFVYKKAISSAVSTKVSIPMLLNMQRNPENFNPLIGFKTNLLTLAKRRNFTVYVYSKQDKTSIAGYMPMKSIDYSKTVADYNKKDNKSYDTVLLEDLKKINFNKNNFIILHQRACHSPYVKNYPVSFEKYKSNKNNFKEYISNTYDNCVLFTDSFLYEAINIIKEKSKTKRHITYFFFTPDHAELLGQDGKYGHTILDLRVAKVPFLFYGINNFLSSKILTSKGVFTHYKISKLIASSLGFTVINPNEDNSTIYINGNDLTGKKGFMSFKEDELKEKM